MHVLIAILLAVAGPLLLDEAFRKNRVWAAFVGTLWLLLSLFLVGLNFETAWDFLFAHPLYSAGIVALGAAAFFFVGPGGYLFRHVARLRLVRLAALMVRRLGRRHGISKRLTGDIVAVTVALLLLIPVSLLTLKPDPGYEHALNKLKRDLSMRATDTAATVEAAMAEALDELAAHAALDEAAIAAAHDRLAEEAKAIQVGINPARMSADRRAAWRAELEQIVSTARDNMRTQGAAASRNAMTGLAKRLLDAERPAVTEAARRAIAGTFPDLTERARRRIAEAPANALRELTQSLIESSTTEAIKAGRDVAASEARRILEPKRAEIEAAGRSASRNLAEGGTRAASGEIKRAFDTLKSALDLEDDQRVTQEKKDRWNEALRREEEEKRKREDERVPAAIRERLQAMDRFTPLANTNFLGGTALPPIDVNFAHECAYACLKDNGCDSFAVRKSVPHTCHRWKGRPEPFGDDYFNGARLR